ncbi:MAG: hypothetical protein AAFQ94_09700 [Bacteroidota bacterium]
MSEQHLPIPEFLYHYYELKNGPFRNITEQGPEKGKEIQQNITEGFNSNRPPNYIELRFALEARIKKQFINKGGIATRNDPFYFTLGECKWAESWYVNPGVIKIPIAKFNPKHISFTYPDSMVSFQFHDEPKLATYRKNVNGKIYLLNEIKKEIIDVYGIPSQEKWESEEAMKYDRYIEVQVWDDRVINEFLSKV